MTRLPDAMIFGTMRLDALSLEEATDLLSWLLRNGVERFHSSVEYPSFPLFVDALSGACRRSGKDPAALRHVVKVAAPHFGEGTFSEDDLVGRIRAHADPLGVPGVDVVQWMVRHDLADEAGRLRILQGSADRIGEAVARLAESGLAGRFGCFPYTDAFRDAVIEQPWCTVLVDYLNPLESGCRAVFPRLRPDQRVIGIRPLLPLQPGADRTSEGEGSAPAKDVAELIDHALSAPVVEAVVVGTGRIAHAGEIIAGVRRSTAESRPER